MKAKLINRGNGDYKLYVDETTYATTSDSPYKKLSKQNCDEIFGIVDIEKLAEEYKNKKGSIPTTELEDEIFKLGFKDGFNKAMSLNKDKVFTLEDIKKAIVWAHDKSTEGMYLSRLPVDEFIQSLQQPTEIEVEIVMDSVPADRAPNGWSTFPKLDSNGYLILKRVG